MQISTRQVAEALNLPVHVIEAIEAEDPERLPAPVFARGYTRAYARLLELDADAIVAQYPEQEDQVERVHVIREPRSSASVIRLGLAALLWILGLGVVAGVAWVVWQWSGDGNGSDSAGPVIEAVGQPEEITGRSEPSEVEAAGADRPEAALGSDLRAEDDTGVTTRPDAEPEPMRDSPSVAEPGVTTPQPAESEPFLDTSPRETQAERLASVRTEETAEDLAALRAAARRITAEGDDLLRMEFSEDCWVEVMSATGSLLYGDLNRSGRILVLVGEAPFRVLLGYAPGVRMSFNGEAVVLTPHTRNAVADLVLGQ